MPNRNAPSGRIAKVRKRVAVTDGISALNSLAMSFKTKTMMKKSNASRVHPRKLARTAFRWFGVRSLRSLRICMGFYCLHNISSVCNARSPLSKRVSGQDTSFFASAKKKNAGNYKVN